MDRTQKWILDQIKSFRHHTASAHVLSFVNLLAPDFVNEIIEELNLTFRERIYTAFWQVNTLD